MGKDLNLFEEDGAILLSVRLQPNAKNNKILGSHAGALQIQVKESPQKNQANSKLLELLASWLNLDRQNIIIMTGHHSRNKKIRITGLSCTQLLYSIARYLAPN